MMSAVSPLLDAINPPVPAPCPLTGGPGPGTHQSPRHLVRPASCHHTTTTDGDDGVYLFRKHNLGLF